MTSKSIKKRILDFERGKTLVNNDAAVKSLTDRIMSKNSAIDEKMAKKLANQIAEIANV